MEYKWVRRAAVLFFLITSFFALTWREGHYNSPDETANAFFIRQYVQTGSLRIAEPLNVVGEDLIHPRAVNIVRHDLVPGSFLGMILLYGWVAKIVGLWIVPLLTPLIASIALFFFYKLVRVIFDERIARWSFFLLLIHPAWIYYTSRSLFPNVLFLSLLIIGIYTLLVTFKKGVVSCQLSVVSSGLLIGSALAVRTAEAGWVLSGLILFFLLSSLRQKIKNKQENKQEMQKEHYTEPALERRFGIIRIFGFCAGLLIAFLPIFYYNNQLYGHPFYNGYSQIDSEAVPAIFAWHFQSRFLTTLFSILLPFGIKPLTLLGNFYQYGLWFFWWFAVPSLLGLAMTIRRNVKCQMSNVKCFTCFYVFMFLWLLLYYGSWQFKDTTLLGPTLGTSYVRYWLPIFIFGIPFAAHAISRISSRRLRFGSAAVILFFSFLLVFWYSDESLVPLQRQMRDGRTITKEILARTEPQSVILTERTDKLFFPERRVIFNDPLDEKKIDRVVAKLAARVPVYYYTSLQDHDIAFANQRRLAPHGVAWSGGEEVGGQRLYRLERI